MSWFIEGEHVIGGSRGAAESIMERVRSENPSYWPHGLSIKGFDGGVWLVKRACDGEPIGFLGWQERNLRQGKTGFYAVGILPEHRGKGYAKEAVAKLINEKAASVDRVRAFIVPGNSPSERLASALGVPVTDSNGSDRVKAARWTSRKNAEGHADKHGEDFGGREAYLAFEKAVMEDPEILKRFENAGYRIKGEGKYSQALWNPVDGTVVIRDEKGRTVTVYRSKKAPKQDIRVLPDLQQQVHTIPHGEEKAACSR